MSGPWEKWRHRRLQILLSAYLDQQLRAGEQLRVEAHLQRCAACRRELEELRATVRLLQQVPQPALPRSFVLRAAPTPSPAWGAGGLVRLLRPMQAAAVAAVVVLMAVALGDVGGVLPRDAGGLALLEERRAATEAAPEADVSETAAPEIMAAEGPPESGEPVEEADLDESLLPQPAPGVEPTSSRYVVYLEVTILALATLLVAVALALRFRTRTAGN